MAQVKRQDARKGDLITFTVSTRDGRRKATRKIVEVEGQMIYVRYAGYAQFQIGGFPSDKVHSITREAAQ